MSHIIGQESDPTAPSTGKAHLYLATDNLVKAVKPDGSIDVLSGGLNNRNLLANSCFWFAQRQAPATPTTYSNTTGRTYGADRWGITNENASAQYARVDTASAAETGLLSRYYGTFTKITSTGKIIVSQVIEGNDVMPYRGRRVRFQMKARSSVGTHTLRMVLLQLATAGTIDTMPATFASAFGAAGTDPTWGTNLAAITPVLANSGCTVVGTGLTCPLTTTWTRFGGVFTVPTDCKNLVAVVFTNGQPVAADAFCLGEIGLFDGDEERAFFQADAQVELRRCQRFCNKSFAIDTAPAQAVGNGTAEIRFIETIAGLQINRSQSFAFPVIMRAAPMATTYSSASASAEARDITGAFDCTNTSVVAITERCFGVSARCTATSAVGNILGVHILFEAEL